MSDSSEKPMPLSEHLNHLAKHHGEGAGHGQATKRDHEFLSQVRVVSTESGHEVISIPVPMTIKSQIGNPVS